jgi:hypothetical protein
MARRPVHWLSLCVAVAVIASAAHTPATALAASTRSVPGAYPTIQAAIDAAATGDTVMVGPGTYQENIDFMGKAITVTSAQGPSVTIIDGGRKTQVVRFATGEGPGSVLQGFTIQHGLDTDFLGGGVGISSASPTIQNNVIANNMACGDGAGIYVAGGSPVITGNVITGNGTACADTVGGGILLGGPGSAQVIGNTITQNNGLSGAGIAMNAAGTPTIQNNVITGNSANGGDGGGLYAINDSDPLVVQNLIAGNQATGNGGGWFDEPTSLSVGPTVINNTFAGNTIPATHQGSALWLANFGSNTRFSNNIFQSSQGPVPVHCETDTGAFDHNDAFAAQGGPGFESQPPATMCAGLPGTNGNVSADPRFLAPGDYHIGLGSAASMPATARLRCSRRPTWTDIRALSAAPWTWAPTRRR